MYFATPSQLTKKGIIGMNMRNVVYIAENNPRHLYPLVDDKLKTKVLCEKAGIAIPKLLGVVRYQQHVRQLATFLEDKGAFVIKPSKGSGGKGILVISGRDGSNYLKPSGSIIHDIDLCRHASNTLSGLFSLGGNPDVAMIEEMVQFSDVFNGFSYQGVPDIRIIVYKGYPVMAMTRLSTGQSDGKANLHQGAVGVGLDIGSGKALLAVQHGRPVKKHPDTGRLLSELAVPEWPVFLKLAAQCYEVTGLGYLGADIVLDVNKGPQILELNARPGLAIQVANGTGLSPRIKLINEEAKKIRKVDGRVAFSLKHFASL
jgi:alpha-L-glutamate ligase-like protein